MLTLIGLGLCDGLDITLRGKQAVDAAAHVFIESYTSLLRCSHEELEQQLGRAIERLMRADVEVDIDRVLTLAKEADVALLVIGDVFGATTHTDLYVRARTQGVAVHVVHNASILNAVGAVGLELYRYGRVVSIPYWSAGFEPTSFLDGIAANRTLGLHTLCLLDIKADEERFMSVAQAILHLRNALARQHEPQAERQQELALPMETLAVGVARIGHPDQCVVAASLAQLAQLDFGKPPHALIIPGKLHHIEEEMLGFWKSSE